MLFASLRACTPLTHSPAFPPAPRPVPGTPTCNSPHKNTPHPTHPRPGVVTSWNPSLADGPDGRSRMTKRDQALANAVVVDGYHAPRLTGRDRLKSRADMDKANLDADADAVEVGAVAALSAAAAQGAVTFGLNLLHAHLKRGTLGALEEKKATAKATASARAAARATTAVGAAVGAADGVGVGTVAAVENLEGIDTDTDMALLVQMADPFVSLLAVAIRTSGTHPP